MNLTEANYLYAIIDKIERLDKTYIHLGVKHNILSYLNTSTCA